MSVKEFYALFLRLLENAGDKPAADLLKGLNMSMPKQLGQLVRQIQEIQGI